MNEHKRLKDVFKLDDDTLVPAWADWTDKGVFTRLKAIAPWGDSVDEKQLNDLYALSRQEKILSPLGVGVFYGPQYAPGYRLSGGSTYIANLAYTKFSEKWTRLWAARTMEYNPIENYNMIETGEDSTTKTGSISRTDTGSITDTHTGTDTLAKSGEETHSKGGSEVHTFAGKETTTNTVTNNNTGTNNGVYGFNSATAVPSDTSTGTQTGLSDSELEFTNRTNTDSFNNRVDTDGFTNRQDTQTKNLTDTETRNLSGGETYNNVKDETDHFLTRSGNIGVTTTQQMLEQELNIWDVFDYFEIVFKDIDSIMLLDIY